MFIYSTFCTVQLVYSKRKRGGEKRKEKKEEDAVSLSRVSELLVWTEIPWSYFVGDAFTCRTFLLLGTKTTFQPLSHPITTKQM